MSAALLAWWLADAALPFAEKVDNAWHLRVTKRIRDLDKFLSEIMDNNESIGDALRVLHQEDPVALAKLARLIGWVTSPQVDAHAIRASA
jgi:hypothetical protein